MDSDSDDGILMFVPAALQSNPPTPTRLSMVGSGTGSITYEGDASHFQPHSDSYYYNAHSHRPGGSHPTLHATAGLQAFPRPRDSYDAADSIAANGNGGDICNPPIDSRLERRKKNQYKRHGSLTLAWQQRLSNNSMRDPAQTKTRLSSEIIDSADSGSPIPTPATGSWYRPHQLRNSGSSTALFSGQSRHDKVRRVSTLAASEEQLQRKSRWRSGSLATVNPATSASSSAHGYGSRTGSSLFAPVNGYRTSGHEIGYHGLGATSSGNNASADYMTTRFAYECGTNGDNRDGANALAAAGAGPHGLYQLEPPPASASEPTAWEGHAATEPSHLRQGAGRASYLLSSAQDMDDEADDGASILMIACSASRSDARSSDSDASLTALHAHVCEEQLSASRTHLAEACPHSRWLATSYEQSHLMGAGGSTGASPRRSSTALAARNSAGFSSGACDFCDARFADSEYNLVPLGLRGDSVSPNAAHSASVLASSDGRDSSSTSLLAATSREPGGTSENNQKSFAFGDNCKQSGNKLPESASAWLADAAADAVEFDMAQSTSASRGTLKGAAPYYAASGAASQPGAATAFSSLSSLQSCRQQTLSVSHHSSSALHLPSSPAPVHGSPSTIFPAIYSAVSLDPRCRSGNLGNSAAASCLAQIPKDTAGVSTGRALQTVRAGAEDSLQTGRIQHSLPICPPPSGPLPSIPVDMAVPSSPLSTPMASVSTGPPLLQTPDNGDNSIGAGGAGQSASTANTTAVCTPATAGRQGSSVLEHGELTRVDNGSSCGIPLADRPHTVAESPTQLIAHMKQQDMCNSAQHQQFEDLTEQLQASACLAPKTPASDMSGNPTYAGERTKGICGELRLHKGCTSEEMRPDMLVVSSNELARHPTLVFDRSPILPASTIIGPALAVSSDEANPSPLPETNAANAHALLLTGAPSNKSLGNDVPLIECRPSEEFAHETGAAYASLLGQTRESAAADDAVHSGSTSSTEQSTPDSAPVIPRPRHQLASANCRNGDRVATEASLCRNSLFPNVVKQQSRCMSVLLQQGPHGGIRRIGPLLITQERGGGAIKHLNPAFIDMMDVQPVDSSTAAFLKRSNIRRRSFSMPPNGPGGDWLNTLSHIIGAPASSGGSKRPNDVPSSGPGMWWPLNDDNCSEEVTHDVHLPLQDGSEHATRGANVQQHMLERMGSSSSVAGTGFKPPTMLGAPRKGSVSSQLRLMVRADSSQGSTGGSGAYLRSNPSQSSFVGYSGHVPSLCHTQSDTSELSSSSSSATRQQASLFGPNNLPMHTAGHQLADVTMKTEVGLITRSIKCISLRLLVNRLASPEGNVDSDLLTDFLNSYRFFAHPIDVMRLIIVRYLNCFAASTSADETEDSESDDCNGSANDADPMFLTINGWRSSAKCDTASSSDQAAPLVGTKGAAGDARPAPTRQLPPLARNDGAIIQLRVMNIVKYWIKFHPHDFRLHHRLTRLLLFFLSHIQKQPGRAEFVNAIRQKLSSGKLLAVEMPAFASTTIPIGTSPSTAVPSQSSSMRDSGVRTPTLEHTRSALDLRPSTTQSAFSQATSALSRPEFALSELSSGTIIGHANASSSSGGHLHSSVSLLDMHGQTSGSGGAPRHQVANGGSHVAAAASASGQRTQHTKKGSTSYFKSLFHSRSNRSNVSSLEGIDAVGESDGSSRSTADPMRAAQRDGGLAASNNGTAPAANGLDAESELRVPNGNMYDSDFGQLVMDALTKSGIPTPQTPVGQTLLKYSIANRNPYRVNLVGIDPATFAEQLTLLEHELFSRISATEFSLKGRVGNLETILHAMQGVSADSRCSVATLGSSLPGQGQSGPTNPVPSLTAMTSWFNQATYWAVLAVLSEPTSAARALVIKQLVHVAFHCLARRNYYGAFEIVIALDNSAVRRLHETWALVPALLKDIVARVLQVLQSRMNFRTYRESVKAAMAGVSGPDEEVFDAISDQIKYIRAKDMISASQANIVTSGGISSATSTGHSSASAAFDNLIHGARLGSGSDEGKQHSRKKSSAHANVFASKDAGQLTEQDCACITYAIRIRAASFMYFDPSTSNGPSGAGSSVGYGHSSAPATSSAKGGRGSGGHLSSGSSKSSGNLASGGSGTSLVGGAEVGDSRSRRTRSTSNSSNGAAGGRTTPTFKNGRMITNGAPLPLVPFVAVHMTDLLHADEANSTYSEEHQKMRSRNPTGPDMDVAINCALDIDNTTQGSKRQLRCDSAAISSVNQAQPLLNMQKFRLITSMFRELHLAQRTKYPYAADMMLQQQIHSAVRNIRAQTNDIFAVVQDIAADDPLAARPATSHVPPFARARTGSSSSRHGAPSGRDSPEPSAFAYPLYEIAAMQTSQGGASLLDASMDWDCTDVKDNQELEQRLYMLSKWIEPQAAQR